jgi:hypothetical protein
MIEYSNGRSNVLSEALFLRETILRHMGHAVAFVRPGARFARFPLFFEQFANSEFDVAAHPHHGNDPFAGTLLVRCNHKTRQMAEMMACAKPHKGSDFADWEALVASLDADRLGALSLNLARIPDEYCSHKLDGMCSPVIIHRNPENDL